MFVIMRYWRETDGLKKWLIPKLNYSPSNIHKQVPLHKISVYLVSCNGKSRS